jgi:hypothetical protein
MASCPLGRGADATGHFRPALPPAHPRNKQDADGRPMDIDLRWVNGVMAFLAAANFVVSAIHTVLLFAG